MFQWRCCFNAIPYSPRFLPRVVISKRKNLCQVFGETVEFDHSMSVWVTGTSWKVDRPNRLKEWRRKRSRFYTDQIALTQRHTFCVSREKKNWKVSKRNALCNIGNNTWKDLGGNSGGNRWWNHGRNHYWDPGKSRWKNPERNHWDNPRRNP